MGTATRLIINADDFGLTKGINRAIFELHGAGALTSATLMASGAAFEDAVEGAKRRPELGLGCHIVLTDGVPVSRPQTIPSLVSRDGRTLRPKLYSFLGALLTGQIDPTDIEREAVAQIRRIQSRGLTVTHLDTHKHTHLLPIVLKPLLRAAAKTGVPAIRNPFEQPWAFKLSSGQGARTSQLRLVQQFRRQFLHQPPLQSGQIRTTDGTIGVSATGSLDQETLRNLLAAIPAGTWELVCHPGHNDKELQSVPTRLRQSREVEREALLQVLSVAARSHRTGAVASPVVPKLIHYGELQNDITPELLDQHLTTT